MLKRLLLSCYPSLWRQRYGEEMQALLEETKITPKTVIDMLLGAFEAWTDPAFHDQSKEARSIRLDYHWSFSLTAITLIALIAAYTAYFYPMNSIPEPYLLESLNWLVSIPMVIAGICYAAIAAFIVWLIPTLWQALRKREHFIDRSFLLGLIVSVAICVSFSLLHNHFLLSLGIQLCLLGPSLTLLNAHIWQRWFSRQCKEAIVLISTQIAIVLLPYIVIKLLSFAGIVSLPEYIPVIGSYVSQSAFILAVPFMLLTLAIYAQKQGKWQRLIRHIWQAAGLLFFAILSYLVALDIPFRLYREVIIPLNDHSAFLNKLHITLWYPLGLSLFLLYLLSAAARTQIQGRRRLALMEEKELGESLQDPLIMEQQQSL